MILMNRYDEVMSKITITPQMQQRIMNNIQEIDFESQPKKVYFLKNYKKYFSIAACALVCIVGTLLVSERIKLEQEPLQQAIPDIVEYSSRNELSSAVGFDVMEVQNIPFDVEETEYISYWKKLAEIVYLGSENTLTFRMSVGNEEISGNYNEYEEVKSYSVDSWIVTIKGKNGLYNLAIWSDSVFSYALEVDTSVSETDLLSMIQSIK